MMNCFSFPLLICLKTKVSILYTVHCQSICKSRRHQELRMSMPTAVGASSNRCEPIPIICLESLSFTCPVSKAAITGRRTDKGLSGTWSSGQSHPLFRKQQKNFQRNKSEKWEEFWHRPMLFNSFKLKGDKYSDLD